jgi:hypothetical protein
MPTFDTLKPITATLHVEIGDTRVTATDRADTVVEVHPSTPDNKDDLRAAKETKVEYADGRLTVRTPKARGLFGPKGSVFLEVSVPSGSRLTGIIQVGNLNATGPLDACDVRTSAGTLRVEQARTAQLKTSYGDVTLDRSLGDADVSTSSGDVRIREIGGNAVLKNSNGATWIDDVAGELRVKSANGNITIGRAQASVVAKTANGNIRVEEVARGAVEFETKTGHVEVGIRPGTAAWLDVNSKSGRVSSDLGATEAPAEGAETVRVHARTGFGDIRIQRAPHTTTDGEAR